MKRTYQPKKKKRKRKHGFLKRMRSAEGQKVIKRRRSRGRKQLTVSDEMRTLMSKPKHTLR